MSPVSARTATTRRNRWGPFVLRADAAEPDGLVGENAAILRRFALLHHLVLSIVLHTRDKQDLLLGPAGEQAVVVIPTVIDDDRPRSKRELMRDLDVMNLALGDDTEAGQVPVMVEHHVQLHRSLGAPKFRPIEDTHTQIDHRRVQAHQLVLEAELVFCLDAAAHPLKQLVEHLLVQLPGPMAVGVGQRGTRRRLDPKVCKLAFTALQSAADLAQRVRPPQLAEHHRYKLAPTAQSLRRALRTRISDQFLEFQPWNELEYLAEHAA